MAGNELPKERVRASLEDKGACHGLQGRPRLLSKMTGQVLVDLSLVLLRLDPEARVRSTIVVRSRCPSGEKYQGMMNICILKL